MRRPELAEEASQIAQFESYVCSGSIDREKNRYRFYTMLWQPTLWGEAGTVCYWGRIGARGRWTSRLYRDRPSAQKELQESIRRRLLHGYELVDRG